MNLDARQARREAARRRTRRQRRAAVAALAAALLLLTVGAFAMGGAGGLSLRGDGEAARSASAATQKQPPAPPQLPRGGREIFPRYRVVGFYGAPQAAELGILGIGTPTRAARRLRTQAAAYRRGGRPVMPALELISTIVNSTPGADGKYRTRQKRRVIRRYLKAARRARALLVLDIQPGRASFIDEAKALEPWLRQPDVGLALDPEWHMQDGEIPGQSIGSVTAEEINEVSTWLSDLTRRERLPEKLLVVHRFTDEMVEQAEELDQRPGVALTLNVDGFGTKEQKVAKYRDLVPRRLNAGFKLFYREDEGLMKPEEVLRLEPQPDLVVYE